MAGKAGKSGRKTKEGLDYFPLYIDLFEHPKILMAMELVDPDGNLPFLRLNCATVYILFLREIYKTSFAIPWTNDRTLGFSASIGKGISYKHMVLFIDAFFKVHLFSRHIYEKQCLLTGGGVIEIWIDRMKRRKRIVDKSRAEHILKQIISEEKSLSVEETHFSTHEKHFPLSTTTILSNKDNTVKSRRRKKHFNAEEKSISVEEILVPVEEITISVEEKLKPVEEKLISVEEKSKKSVTLSSIMNIGDMAELYKTHNVFRDSRGQHMHAAGFDIADDERFNGFVDAFVVWKKSKGDLVIRGADFCSHLFLWLQKQGAKLSGDPREVYKFKNHNNNGNKQQRNGHEQAHQGVQSGDKIGGIPADKVAEFLKGRTKP